MFVQTSKKRPPALRPPQIFEALDTDEPSDMVAYPRLFDSDSDMNQTMTAEALRAQCLAEHLEHLQASSGRRPARAPD